MRLAREFETVRRMGLPVRLVRLGLALFLAALVLVLLGACGGGGGGGGTTPPPAITSFTAAKSPITVGSATTYRFL